MTDLKYLPGLPSRQEHPLLFPSSGQLLEKGENIHALDEDYRVLLGSRPQDFGCCPGCPPAASALRRPPVHFPAEAGRRTGELLEPAGLIVGAALTGWSCFRQRKPEC